MDRFSELQRAGYPGVNHDAEVIGATIYDHIIIRKIAGENFGIVPQRQQLFIDDTKKVICNSKFPVMAGRAFEALYGRVDMIFNVQGQNQMNVFENQARFTYKNNDKDYGYISLQELLPYQRVNIAGERQFAGKTVLSSTAPEVSATSAVATPGAGDTCQTPDGKIWIYNGTAWVEINTSYLDKNTVLPRQQGWFTLPNKFVITNASSFEINFESNGQFLTTNIDENPAYFGSGVLDTNDIPVMYIRLALRGNLKRVTAV